MREILSAIRPLSFRHHKKDFGSLLGALLEDMPTSAAHSPLNAGFRYVILGGDSGAANIALLDDIMAKYRNGDRLLFFCAPCFSRILSTGAQIGMAESDFTEYR